MKARQEGLWPSEIREACQHGVRSLEGVPHQTCLWNGVVISLLPEVRGLSRGSLENFSYPGSFGSLNTTHTQDTSKPSSLMGKKGLRLTFRVPLLGGQYLWKLKEVFHILCKEVDKNWYLHMQNTSKCICCRLVKLICHFCHFISVDTGPWMRNKMMLSVPLRRLR